MKPITLGVAMRAVCRLRDACKGVRRAAWAPDGVGRLSAALAAIMLALAGQNAHALINVTVRANFPAFANGPVFGSSGPEAFEITFLVDESAAVHYPAGFELLPGLAFMTHDVYAIGYPAILGATNFSFGTQAFSGMSLHNLGLALTNSGVAAPMFLSDITPGSTPFIEAALAPGFLGLGSYSLGTFVPPALQAVSLTNEAQVWDGVNEAFGTVSVSISAVPEPGQAALWCLGLTTIFAAGARRFMVRGTSRRVSTGATTLRSASTATFKRKGNHP